MTKSATLVSVEEYLRTSYDPDVDYVDGVLEGRNLGEFEHSDLQTEIAFWVRQRYRAKGLNAFVELRAQVSPTRFRVPDVVITQGKRPKGGVLTVPPVAVIEVLSPEDRMSRVQKRIEDYLKLGARYCWLIDPQSRRAWSYSTAGAFEIKDLILRGENPEFAIPLPEIFAAMDEMTEG
ncbi:MAG: Uma2 family endonuclease [Acidobacteria bacterium]|nr:Uma2 family endonuclease [Acidobacteriota bacterium]